MATEDQIARLELRLKDLRMRKVRSARRKRRMDAHRDRKDDTRRKILVGAVVLAKVKQGVLEDSRLRGWLDAALTRVEDRALFGFEDSNRDSAAG